MSGGYVKINPELKETNELIQWAKHNAGDLSNLNIPELTTARYDNINVPRLTFAQVKEMKLGNKVESKHDKKHADFFTVAATITTISQSADRKPWYEANPDPKSEARNAKVVAIGDGQWKCEKNGKVYPGYTPRYILRFCATDFSGNIWLTAYDAAAQKILQTSATKLEELYNNDREQYDLIFKQAQFKKFVFKCRAWCDVWKDDKTPKYDVLDCAEIDHEHESEQLIEKIKLLENSQK